MLEKIRAHLISRDEKTETHAAAMELLQERGFSYAAARKWLQRHPYSEALTAGPAEAAVNPAGYLIAADRAAAWVSS